MSRYALRAGLLPVTEQSRLAICGRKVAFNAKGVQLTIEAGAAHFSGLMLCGLVWLCPVCGPNIRQKRADEIDEALRRAVDLGLGVLMLTLTCRHDRSHDLLDLRKRQEAAWKRLMQSKPWRRLVKDLGLGFVQQREVTHSHRNGWHPHRHLALVLDRELSDDEIEAVRAELFQAWLTALKAVGLSAEETWVSPAGEVKHPGLDLRRGDGETIAGYMLKVRGEDGGDGGDLAMELMRGDLKQGHHGRRTPEQLVEDLVVHEKPADLALWRQYEKGVTGWRMTTWSTGLRKRLALPEEELTDEQLVELNIGGLVLATVMPGGWPVIEKASPGGVDLLDAAEAGTWRKYLLRHLGPPGSSWVLGPV